MEQVTRDYRRAIDLHRLQADEPGVAESLPLGIVAGTAQRFVLQGAEFDGVGPGHGTGAAGGSEGFQVPDRRRKIEQFVFFKAGSLKLLPIAQEEGRAEILIRQTFNVEG